jgi:hypothetical protein
LRADSEDGNNDSEDQVGGDEERVEPASATREKDVQDDGERNSGDEEPERRSDEDELPEIRIGLFPILEAGFGPGMGKVDEEDETDEDEEAGADGRDVGTVGHEEFVGDEEGEEGEEEVETDLDAPPAVMSAGIRRSRGSYRN